MDLTPPPFSPPRGTGVAPPPTVSGWGGPPEVVEPATAQPLSQLIVYLTCFLAIALVGTATEEVTRSVAGGLALGAGIAVGLAAQMQRLFRTVSGLVGAVAALVIVAVAGAVVASKGGSVDPVIFVVVPLFVLGLDWSQVRRLRPVVFLSGLLVVPVVAAEKGWALPAAIAWLVMALVALWLLEQDRRLARPRAAPVSSAVNASPEPSSSDLARVVAIALAVGLAAAFVLGQPSCSPDSPNPPDFSAGGGPSFPDSSADSATPSTSGPSGPARSGEVPDQYRSGGPNQERRYEVDEDGNTSFVDPETGETFTVEDDGDGTGARVFNSDGEEVARLDQNGLAATDSDGTSQHYQYDDQGRLFVTGQNGERLYLDTSGGVAVLRDEDGRIVAQGQDGSADHLVIADPDGNVVVPDPDGDGTIPAPNGAVRNGVVPDDGTTFSTDAKGDTVVRDTDGGSRIYSTAPDGSPQVTVIDPAGPVRIYRYDEVGPDQHVYEYDGSGRLLRTYIYDPDGMLIDPLPYRSDGSGASSPDEHTSGSAIDGSSSDVAGAANPDEPGQPAPVNWWLIAGLVAAIVGAGVVAWLVLRRPEDPEPEPTWAQILVARIESFGGAHGFHRGSSETIVDYTERLAREITPDPRLAAVGQVLSGALFDRAEPPEPTRMWATDAVDEIVEGHPPPTRREVRQQQKA